jgi:hypothetical protein
MANVYVPQKKSQAGSLFGLAGTVVGSIYGGPAGGAIGGQIGGMIGGAGDKPGPQAISTEANAMQRRQLAKQGDTFQHMRDAVDSFNSLPDDMRKEYARPVLSTYVAEAQKRGIDPFAKG